VNRVLFSISDKHWKKPTWTTGFLLLACFFIVNIYTTHQMLAELFCKYVTLGHINLPFLCHKDENFEIKQFFQVHRYFLIACDKTVHLPGLGWCLHWVSCVTVWELFHLWHQEISPGATLSMEPGGVPALTVWQPPLIPWPMATLWNHRSLWSPGNAKWVHGEARRS
jgi:hypothetical protein